MNRVEKIQKVQSTYIPYLNSDKGGNMSEYRLLKMQEDLNRALKKPENKRSWIMVIDIDKCIGCKSCKIACKSENILPPNVYYRHVYETEFGDFPKVKRVFMPTNCQQCDNPPCIKGLPKDYYTKRKDGILVFNYKKMKGQSLFNKVKKNCPYTAVYFDKGDFFTQHTPKLEPYELVDNFEYGNRWDRKKNLKGTIRKCHFCLHRLNNGMLPACVSICVGGAMYFGDKNDPRSLVSMLLKKKHITTIPSDTKTKPRVYYVSEKIISVNECAMCHG